MSISDSGSEHPIVIEDPVTSRDNEVRPFRIEGMDVRGRAVRLGTVAQQIIAAHDYPDPVARILGEFLALAALLGSIIKYDGIVTLQAKSAGPLPMIVTDFTRVQEGIGHLRGYMSVDETKLAHYGKDPSFHGLIGSKEGGYLAMTIDQGSDMERYQGIVDLKGETLSDIARTYFKSSEQTPTEIRLTSDRDPVTGHWRAGGIMVQYLAHGEEGRERIFVRETDDEWGRASILMHSVTKEELLDPALDLDRLLYRLFNEDGVRVFDPWRLIAQCRCDRGRLLGVLRQFSADDIDHMTENGKISVNCQFCNKTYEFDPDDLSGDADTGPGPSAGAVH